jgi:hypothetical protein
LVSMFLPLPSSLSEPDRFISFCRGSHAMLVLRLSARNSTGQFTDHGHRERSELHALDRTLAYALTAAVKATDASTVCVMDDTTLLPFRPPDPSAPPNTPPRSTPAAPASNSSSDRPTSPLGAAQLLAQHAQPRLLRRSALPPPHHPGTRSFANSA